MRSPRQPSRSFRRRTEAWALGVVLAVMTPAPALAEPGLDAPEAIGPYLNGVFPPAEPVASNEWTVEQTYDGIQINLPMHLLPFPGTDQLLCVAKEGRIFLFDDDPQATTASVLLDHRGETFTSSDSGMAWLVFHPDFGVPGNPNRGYVYVTYKWRPGLTGPAAYAYWRLSRFTVPDNPQSGVPDGSVAIDPASEQVMIQQLDRQQWHDSGCMTFGPDGYLYVAIGDEGGANDEFSVSQRIDDRLFSGILRIDVDQGPGTHAIPRQPAQTGVPIGWPANFTAHYTIPDDNPFDPVADGGSPGDYLEEFYAIGLRQPYRFSYDAATDRFWIGESGQDTAEELCLLAPGANYGWAFREGSVSGPKAMPGSIHGTLAEPVWDVLHANGPDGCVVGGFVYRGAAHPSLTGKFITVDNVSGRIRAFTYEDPLASGEILTNMPSGSVYQGTSTIGRDHAGEPVFVKISGTGTAGRFYKLAVVPATPDRPVWYRFEDRAPANTSGYLNDNPDDATADDIAGGTRLIAADDGANASFAASNELVPTGETSNHAGVRMALGDGDGYPGNLNGALETEHAFGVLDDFTIELSFRPAAGSLGGGYQCFLGLDGTSGTAPTDGEAGPPIQPFRLMRWGRNDASATSIPLENGDLYLNVRTLDAATGQWTSVPVEIFDNSDFVTDRWYHLAIVGDAAAGTVTVHSFEGSGYVVRGQASGYVGNLQSGVWSLGRGMYNGNRADWV
ncbi:MAG: PQQ-dependent sugar dehydrogenase, partial [Verrucomicrobiae bacterium]|nr:PQQ-dependent sugar dehydrogenase [Verrucomicrobiae bacterium]